MRKILFLACGVAVLAGCLSNPFFSTSYGKAHPSSAYTNSDGSTSVEFKFILDIFDSRKAMQRIDEYLAGYAKEKDFTGYDVEKVDDKPIEKSKSGAGLWVDPASENFVLDQSDIYTASGKPQYVRILVQVRFKTQT